MTARVLSVADLDVAARLLSDGAIVGIPTDTVYGIAARCDSDAAVAALFDAKRRPDAVPIAVLCATADEAVGIAVRWPRAAAVLAAAHWPGPLTVVVDADAALAARIGAAGTVGLRVPDDEACLGLLSMTGPLAVSSANLHGEPPATSARAVVATFGDAIAAVVDAGERSGTVSTVVDVTGAHTVVVREGSISAATVRASER